MTLLEDRWATGELTGAAQHALVVRVRKGVIKRGWFVENRIDNGKLIVPPEIWKGVNYPVWQGLWTPQSPWATLPNIQSAKHTRGFDQKGSSSATILMDNVAFPAATGLAGEYHQIKRGFYSPMRGAAGSSRPDLWDDTGWTDRLNGGYQIELWEGYGTGAEIVPLEDPIDQTIDGRMMSSCAPAGGAMKRTWTGLIEDIDMESHPDHITITARDFGILFTDQRLQGDNKSRECPAPITFGDRKAILGAKALSDPKFNANGSDERISAPYDDANEWWYSMVITTDPNTHTESFSVSAPASIAYVSSGLGMTTQDVPAYAFDGMEGFLAIYIPPGEGALVDGTDIHGSGWLDIGAGSASVDGVDIPYVLHVPEIPTEQYGNTGANGPMDATGMSEIQLGHGYDLPPGAWIVMFVTKLHQATGAESVGGHFNVTPGKFYAALSYFALIIFGTDPQNPPYDPSSGISWQDWYYNQGNGGVDADYWVLVEDASDIVLMLTIWAGFKEWKIDKFGWTIQNPMQYGEDKYFIDVIDDVLTQGNFIFFMAPPTDDDRSIGVPTLEYQGILNPPSALTPELTEDKLLETAQVKWDLSNLPGVVRYRGNPVDNGQTYEQDLVPAYMATYYPPWSTDRADGQGIPRTAGVMRHFLQSLGVGVVIGLNSDEECQFACVLAALQYAVAMCTGQTQIPGLPGITLNGQVSVVDEGSGINSRMWVASVDSTHTLGPQGKWEIVVAGSYIDIDDYDVLKRDYTSAYIAVQQVRAQSQIPLANGSSTPPAVTGVIP